MCDDVSGYNNNVQRLSTNQFHLNANSGSSVQHDPSVEFEGKSWTIFKVINLLATDFFFQILSHPLFKM